MSTVITRVPQTSVDLTGEIPSNSVVIPLPADTVAIDVLVHGAKLSTGSWGFRLADTSVITTAYKQGHAKFTSTTSSVSSAGTWFVFCSHDSTDQDWYGTARFFCVDDPANRWGYSGETWQVSSDNGAVRAYRPSGGTVNLSSGIEELHLWGSATNAFTAGTLSVVAWVKESL